MEWGQIFLDLWLLAEKGMAFKSILWPHLHSPENHHCYLYTLIVNIAIGILFKIHDDCWGKTSQLVVTIIAELCFCLKLP